MVRAAIIGATGYTGLELVRTLLGHPRIDLIYLSGESTAGKPYAELYPHLEGKVDLVAEKYELAQIKRLNPDVIFIALPHSLSMEIVPELYEAGPRIIDLGADFRLTDACKFEQWYSHVHSAPQLLPHAVYGLPEKYRDAIRSARLVANPGCYPTSAILGVWPLIAAGLKVGSVIIDAKSGVSGAGKKPKDSTHYPNCNESVTAYKVLRHQHTPEIAQEAGLDVLFTTHLVPMTRGILSTIYISVGQTYTEEEVRSVFQSYYQDEPFVTVMPKGVELSTKMVAGSNNCFLQVYVDTIKSIIVVTSVIDNLIKGASGQAVQNCNIMFGLPEKSGLSDVAIYP